TKSVNLAVRSQESGDRSQEIIFIFSPHTPHPTPHTPHPTSPLPDFPKVTKPDILLNSRLSHQPDLVVVQCSLPRY
ncbi:MAG: hypothetical protein ACKO90_16575, partial [Microcystis panniformis]